MTTKRRASLRGVDRELIREALAALCEEMAVSLLRTSHSETVKSAMDFSTALCDARGEIISQSVSLPNQLGAIPDAAAAMIAAFGGRLRPGDVVILNDPFAGGTHLPDVFILKPVFVGRRIAALAATVAHHADLGGLVAGSMSPVADESYQEGLRIPPSRLVEAGHLNETIVALIRANSRVPDVVMGDLTAQLVACDVGEAGFKALVRAYGEARLWAGIHDLLDYTEALTRSEIDDLPDGRYEFRDELDDDGVHPGRVPIQVAVTISGGAVDLDFTGSSEQVRSSLNCTLSFTKSCAYAAIRSVLQADIPDNGAFFRPITVRAPSGSILNCQLPAATGTRGLTGFRVIDAVFGALGQAVPERVMAASDGGLSLVGVAGFAGGERFTVLELVSGSWGGRAERDGIEGVSNLGANVSNIPIELLEAAYPVRIERYGFVPDTGGAGRYRGGNSVERVYRFLAPATLTVRSDRQDTRPYGLVGGLPGQSSRNELVSDGRRVKLSSKFSRQVARGDVFDHRMAGGGGWGDPLDREPARVAADIAAGLVSQDLARARYGVLVTADGVVDGRATASLRRRRRAAARRAAARSASLPGGG